MEKKVYVELKGRIDWLLRKHEKPDWTKMVDSRILRILQHNNVTITDERHFRKPSIMKIFRDKFFIYQEEDYLWWGFSIDVNDKGWYPRSYHMYRVRTTLGSIYFHAVEEETEKGRKDRYQCYTTHFFERIQERLKLKSVEHAVKHVMKNKLILLGVKMPEVCSRQSETDNRIIMPMIGGAALGEKFNDIVLLKTFITYDLMTDEQLTEVSFNIVEMLKGTEGMDKQGLKRISEALKIKTNLA